MTSNQFCDMLDRIEVLLDTYSLSQLRKIASEEPGDARNWSRGKCVAEIIDQEFLDYVLRMEG